MTLKTCSLASVLLLVSGAAASASPAMVTNDLHLRSGPGTRYGIIDTLPAGSPVDVLSCAGSWCRVAGPRGEGYVSSSYLDMSGGAFAQAPVVVEPGYYPDYYYYGPAPAVGFGFGFGWPHGWHHWHHHWHH